MRTDGRQIGRRRPRVLLVTASVGAGHNQASRAIREGLALIAPEVEVNYTDVLDYTSRLFRAKYAAGYTMMVTRFPKLYGMGFNWTDRHSSPRRAISERYKIFAETRRLRRFTEFVRQYDPDLIVHTHLLAAPVLAGLRKKGLIDAPQWLLITDVMPHRWWYSQDIERWFVLQNESRAALLRWGIDPARITVSGMPVQSKWNLPLPPRAKLLEELRLPADKKIVLLSGGAVFTCGPIVKIARQLSARHPDVCVVALAGRDKKLLGKLSGLVESRSCQIVPVGFTDCMHKFVAVASLVVTKAGGMITAECLAGAKPMVILKPVPGQERGNAKFFASCGAAIIAGDTRQAIEAVGQLLDDPAMLEDMTQKAAGLYRPARETIAEAISRELQ